MLLLVGIASVLVIADSKLTQWTTYGPCSRSCGEGVQIRTRYCILTKYVGCNAPLIDTKPCMIQRCSAIKSFLCHDARQQSYCKTIKRLGYCKNPTYKAYMQRHCRKTCGLCQTSDSHRPSPVHGAWGQWSTGADCGGDCRRIRTRTCDAPKPKHGGRFCKGPSSDHASCSDHENCKVIQKCEDRSNQHICIEYMKAGQCVDKSSMMHMTYYCGRTCALGPCKVTSNCGIAPARGDTPNPFSGGDRLVPPIKEIARSMRAGRRVVHADYRSAMDAYDVGSARFGQAAVRGNWPWHVGIYYYGSARGELVCGGTLIDYRRVVSAAHCFSSRSKDISKWKVVLGEHHRGRMEGSEQFLPISKITTHERFLYSRTDSNDIAVVTLGKAAVFDDFVQPACLPERGEELEPETYCWVPGWSRTSVSGPIRSVLFEVELPTTSIGSCQKQNEKKYNPKFQIDDQMICAGYGDPSSFFKSGCPGNSGNGFHCQNIKTGKWVVQGVTSYDDLGCYGDKYTVFTKVSRFIQWLQDEEKFY